MPEPEVIRELKGRSKNDLVREVLKLREVLSSTLHGSATDLFYEAGVSIDDGRPFVRLTWGAEAAQQEPAEARHLGLALIEAASAAELDSGLVDMLTGERFGYGIEEAAKVLVLVRQEREKRGGPVMPGARPQDPERRQ